MIPSQDRAVWLAHHVLPHEPALRAWLRRRRIDGLEIDDVVQEAYAVLASLASVDHIDSPRAYAFQTAQSVILRHLRRARVVRIDTFDNLEMLNLSTDEASPEVQASSRQELRRVAELISALPPKCREAFSLRKVDGLSQRDVARRMGISESTVEKHIGRALRTLMDAMRDSGIYPSNASDEQDHRDSRANGRPRDR
jgi:RNA polymerase sigma factor (sigma-70 family)